MKPEELLETADQLQESAAGFKTMETWFAHMEEYREKLRDQPGPRSRLHGACLS